MKIENVATKLYKSSKTLRREASPSAEGYKAVKAWLKPRWNQVIAKYGDVDQRKLIYAINDIASCDSEGLKLTD